MHPILFEIPGTSLKIHTYGVMLALGFLAALAWIRYQAPRVGLPVQKMTDLAFWMLVAAMVGSRIAFILVGWQFYFSHPLEIFKVWEGGLVFYGGLIACIPLAWLYTRRRGFNFWRVADLFMPAVALGHSLGRLGCFAAGCCYGRQCDPRAWYALVFPHDLSSLAPPGVALFPTQLIESLAEFLIFIVLAITSRKKAFDGQILLLYLILYSLLRIGIETLRGDIERGFVISDWMSTSQLIGIVLLFSALIVLIYRRGRSS